MIDHLSFSSITRYLRCGKQWKYHYLEKLPEEKSEALYVGSTWHKMIQSYLLHDNLDLDAAWNNAMESVPEMSDESTQSINNEGLHMLKSLPVCSAITNLDVDLESIEMETELHIPNVPIPVIGYIDMIGVDGIPIDIKTASKKWTQEQADSDLQASFYLASLEQLGMVKFPAKFRYMVFTKTKRPDVQVLQTTRTHADIFALYSLITDVYDAIRREIFLPTNPVNWWCSKKYCSFYDVCEYGGKNDT